MGDTVRNRFSDRGSIPLRSIRRPLKYGLFKPYFKGFFFCSFESAPKSAPRWDFECRKGGACINDIVNSRLNKLLYQKYIMGFYSFRATRCARNPFCFSIVSTVKPAFSAIAMNSHGLCILTSPCPTRFARGISRWFISQTTKSEEV